MYVGVGDVVVDAADQVGLHVHGVEHGVGWFGDELCGWVIGVVSELDVVCAVVGEFVVGGV